jgi:alpha-L-fucosidase
MGPSLIPRRDWLLGTSVSLLALGASSSAAAALGQPGVLSPQSQAASDAEDADRVRRMKWWHEARFGMFIHWGL